MVFKKEKVRWSMSKKTITYLIAIAVLLVANLGLVFTEGQRKSASFNDELFLIDQINEIKSVEIVKEESTIKLELINGVWRLNEVNEADGSFLQLMFSILNQVKIKRVVGAVENTTGTTTITFNSDDQFSFDFASDPLGTRSYFIKDGISYQV